MIVFRLFQGFLGGAMIPTVFATSFILFPPQRRFQFDALAFCLGGLLAQALFRFALQCKFVVATLVVRRNRIGT